MVLYISLERIEWINDVGVVVLFLKGCNSHLRIKTIYVYHNLQLDFPVTVGDRHKTKRKTGSLIVVDPDGRVYRRTKKTYVLFFELILITHPFTFQSGRVRLKVVKYLLWINQTSLSKE